MPVHSLHVFDRKGKTLFTKRFVSNAAEMDAEKLAEQRKLVFGMLFSLREVVASLSPTDNNANGGLHLVKTGASTLYNYETPSGLRFALYISNSPSSSLSSSDNEPVTSDNKGSHGVAPALDASVRAALEYVYNELWIQCVTRSPLYRPTAPNVDETNFDAKLTSFLRAQRWFR